MCLYFSKADKQKIFKSKILRCGYGNKLFLSTAFYTVYTAALQRITYETRYVLVSLSTPDKTNRCNIFYTNTINLFCFEQGI